MHEKMTDEELDALLGGVASPYAVAAIKLERHIAALTAERDEADRQRMAANTAIQGVQDEVNTLRERVQAQTTYKEAWRKRAEAAESTLAAIRQRAGGAKSIRRVVERAFDGRFASLYEVGVTVARYVLGEDDVGFQPVPGFAMPPPAVQAAIRENASPEPTTSEAFATVRRGWQVMEGLEVPAGHSGDEESGQHDEDCALCAHDALLEWSGDAAHALSLLERRMGAMGRSIREAPHDETCAAPGTTAPCNCWKASALADAPPVFTLEEVEAVQKRLEGEVPNPGEQYLNGWLDALDTFRQTLAALRKR